MRMARSWMYLLTAILIIQAPSLALTNTYPGDKEFGCICYPEAAHLYDSLLTRSPHDAQALWRLARVYLCMGDVAPDNQVESYYRQAEQFARQCIAADSAIAEGHTWLAASLGSIAMFEGGKRKVQLTNEIKHELEIALRLDPRDDVAYSILGSFYRALGNISWFERQLASVFLGTLPEGGRPEAETALKHAIEIAPNVMRHRFELGMLYEESDRLADARQEFQAVMNLPVLLARDRRTLELAKAHIAELASR